MAIGVATILHHRRNNGLQIMGFEIVFHGLFLALHFFFLLLRTSGFRTIHQPKV
jgi:hypothetical protein